MVLPVRKKPSHAASSCEETLLRGGPPVWRPNHSPSLGNLPSISNLERIDAELLTLKEDFDFLGTPSGAHVKIWQLAQIFFGRLTRSLGSVGYALALKLVIPVHCMVLLLRASIAIHLDIGLRKESRFHCSFLQLL